MSRPTPDAAPARALAPTGVNTRSTPGTAASSTGASSTVPMTHREVLEALSGLLLALFVAMLSTTIVANALPRIIADLEGNQSQYTWVVTATLLAATASTPIWGKFADRASKKTLIQLAITVFVVGSVLAGFSQSVGMLIAFRVLQGLGMGGLQSLVQIAIAAMVSPRERGRYNGYFGAVMAVATIGGPVLGGLIVDSPLGWRWTFFVGAPIGLAAMVLLQKTLHLPVLRSRVAIDWWGAGLIPGGVSIVLVWISFAGSWFPWVSLPSAAVLAGGLAVLGLGLYAETRADDPIIPLRILRERTVALIVLASVAVGVAMFGSSIFFGQYFQVSRSFGPTQAGLLTVPLMAGLLLTSTITGNLVARTGRWKRFLVAGAALMTVGLLLLGTIDHATALPLIAVYQVVLGIGVGMSLQNMVIAVQNTVSYRDLGSATSTVTFFRSLGGSSGVSVLGAVLAAHVSSLVAAGSSGLAGGSAGSQLGSSTTLDVDSLPAPVAAVVRAAYGDGTALIFLIAAGVALVSLVAVSLIHEVPLRTTVGDDDVLLTSGATAEDARPVAGSTASTGVPVDQLTDRVTDRLPGGDAEGDGPRGPGVGAPVGAGAPARRSPRHRS